jgi:hypothetical protein
VDALGGENGFERVEDELDTLPLGSKCLRELGCHGDRMAVAGHGVKATCD